MANKFQNIEQFAKNFSNRYKVDFSFEKYHSQKLDKKTVEAVSGGDKKMSKENLMYRCTLVNLYRECVENVMKYKLTGFNPAQLANDFERLMNRYRTFQTENDKEAPATRGGWEKDSDVIGAMKDTLKSIEEESLTTDGNNARKESKIVYTQERYLSGNFRLRDMRKDLEALKEKYKDGGYATAEEMVAISIYAETLRKVANEPSWRWRANPLNIPRKMAEKRLLKQLEAFATRHMTYSLAADDLAEEKFLPSVKNDLNKAENEVKASEMQASKEQAVGKNDVEKTKVNLDFLKENQNVKEVSPKVEQHDVPHLENVKSN